VKIPLQGHFATKDDWCTPALVDGFEKAMKEAGKSLELFRYDAEHGFWQRAAPVGARSTVCGTCLGPGDGFLQKTSGMRCIF